MIELPGWLSGLRSRSRTTTLSVVGFLTAALWMTTAPSLTHAADQSLSLKVSYRSQNPLVSVSAQSAPLTEILQQLAAKTGIEIRIDPSVSHRVLQHFKRLPLDTAIQRLVGRHATLLVYGTGSESRQLRAVHVMAGATPAPTPAEDSELPDLASLDVYGNAWLAAHHDTVPHYLPTVSIKAALSWQNYLARLSRKQREELHLRMLAAQAKRAAAGRLAANAMLYGTTYP